MEEKAPVIKAPKGDVEQSSLPPVMSPPIKSPPKSPLLWFGIGLLVVVLGGGYYVLSNKMGQVVKSLTPVPIATVTTSPTTDPTANWLTFTDVHYGFSFKYPNSFQIGGDEAIMNYYDDVATISAGSNSIKIRAIHGIDIYDNTGPYDVAHREIVDSGLKYEIYEKVISGLPAAVSILGAETPILEDTPKSIVIIAHPTKNLFIEFTSNNNNDLDLILSTFRFVEEDKPENVLVLLPEWMPDVTWKETGSLSSEGKTLGPVRSGRGISPTYILPLSTPIEGGLKKKGWEDDFSYAADSPGGQVLGYSKRFGDKTYSVVVVLRAAAQIISKQGEQVQFKPCPCPYEISVSVQEKITE